MTKFVSKEDYATLKDVRAAYPGASEILEVEEGWQVFETFRDAETWRKQA